MASERMTRNVVAECKPPARKPRGGRLPMLHPDLDAMVWRIRKRGAIATLITNGYLLTRDRIQRLNRSGLDYMQVSIDKLPDETSKKSLKSGPETGSAGRAR